MLHVMIFFSLEKSTYDTSLFNAACYDFFLLRRVLVMTSLFNAACYDFFLLRRVLTIQVFLMLHNT